MDRTTKIILAIIAAGLWANAIGGQIRPAFAQEDYGYLLRSIESDVGRIQRGTCTNDKIC